MVLTDALLIAAVPSALSVLGQVIISQKSSKASLKIFEFRLKTIETKVDKHNSFMERLAVIEKGMQYTSENILEIKERCTRQHEDFFGK